MVGTGREMKGRYAGGVLKAREGAVRQVIWIVFWNPSVKTHFPNLDPNLQSHS
jgi:hypothetical protein